MSKQVSIPAVGYCRKSTKGEVGRNGEKRERQEKSIAQQRAEVVKLAQGRFDVLKWFEDEGVSGWKRGAKRPDFQRMLDEVSKLGALAIVCDNLDRFSRAAFDEVQEDVNALRKAGVRWIVTASHGEYDLGQRFDIGCILKFVVAVWSACEYSRQLGRRIALAKRNLALEGKRCGAFAPYAMERDGKHSLKPGDPKQQKIVCWLFDQFANHQRSLCWLASDLNARKVPGPKGGLWYVRVVREMLRGRCYAGDFVYNRKRVGQFYGIDDKGEVVERAELGGEAGKLFVEKGVYAAIIDRDLFDKAQRRLDTLAKDRSRRKRMGYALTGILKCGHCGRPMCGVKQKRWKNYGPTVYRCSANHVLGKGSCGNHQVREDEMLPFIVRLLGEEMKSLKALAQSPPEELTEPHKERGDRRKEAERDHKNLAERIDKAEKNLLDVEDKRTRQSLDKRVAEMRDELDRLAAELAVPADTGTGLSAEDIDAIVRWREGFERTAVGIVIDFEQALKLSWFDGETEFLIIDHETEYAELRVDPIQLNELLHRFGCEVRLLWETQKQTTKSGGEMVRHELVRGRFRLGQQSGKLPRYVLKAPTGRTTARRPGCSRTCAGRSPYHTCPEFQCARAASARPRP